MILVHLNLVAVELLQQSMVEDHQEMMMLYRITWEEELVLEVEQQQQQQQQPQQQSEVSHNVIKCSNIII